MKLIFRGLIAFTCMTLSLTSFAQSGLKTDKEKFSYTVGIQMASGVKRQGLDLDIDVLKRAIDDVFAGREPQLSMDEMQQVLSSFQQQEMEKVKAKANDNKAAGEAFLAKNRKDKNVSETKDGIQYTIVTAGKGKKPKSTDTVVVNYRGTLIDGKEFDSSYKRGQPATFPVNGVIRGWQEVLPLMPVGSKWHVVIPSDLAYGPQGAGGHIGPNETLVFDIELLKIK